MAVAGVGSEDTAVWIDGVEEDSEKNRRDENTDLSLQRDLWQPVSTTHESRGGDVEDANANKGLVMATNVGAAVAAAEGALPRPLPE